LITADFTEQLMKAALAEAAAAAARGEVPIGAVIALNGEIIARAGNRVEEQKSVLAHAELLAIQKASAKLNNWRLEDCTLCVTVEPCTMCYGAIEYARIPTLIFGASEPITGALGSRYDLRASAPWLRVIQGIQEEKAKMLLQDFFNSRRKPGELS
jgi:tRNA(adenine34) deaminase